VLATKRPSQLYAFAMVDRGFGSNAQYLAAKRFKESLSTKFSSDVFADDVEDEHEVLLSARIIGLLFLSFLRSSFSSSSSSSTSSSSSSSSSSVVGLESSPSSSNSPAFPPRRVINAFLRVFETTVLLFVEP
jgi:hypothetical protein